MAEFLELLTEIFFTVMLIAIGCGIFMALTIIAHILTFKEPKIDFDSCEEIIEKLEELQVQHQKEIEILRKKIKKLKDEIIELRFDNNTMKDKLKRYKLEISMKNEYIDLIDMDARHGRRKIID